MTAAKRAASMFPSVVEEDQFALEQQQARFDYKKPVLVGESLTLRAEVVQKVEAVRTIKLAISAAGADGEARIKGSIQAGFLS